MKLVSTILLGLALIPLTFDAWFVYAIYCKLVEPAVTQTSKRFSSERHSDPVLWYWVIGNFLLLFGAALFLLALTQFLKERDGSKPSGRSVTKVLITLADPSLLSQLRPAMALLFLYQIPFVGLLILYWRSPNASFVTLFGSATAMTILFVVLVRTHVRNVMIGELRLELDDDPDVPPLRLSGRIVLPRQSDHRCDPIVMQLEIYENRMPREPVKGASEGPIDLRELYWRIRFESGEAVFNPFETETIFSFEVDVPAWLPRPWTRTIDNYNVGIEWKLEAVGSVARTKFSSAFPIDKIPVALQQPRDMRIRIPIEELGPLLAEQSIHWDFTAPGCSSSIRPSCPHIIDSIVFSALFATIAVCFSYLLWRQPDLFYLWCAFGSWLMTGAILKKQFAYRVIRVDNDQRTLAVDHVIFGYCFRKVIPTDELARVFVQPAKSILTNPNYTNYEYDILLLFRRSDDEQIRVARVKYRLIAKALAKVLATELEVPMEYLAANSRTKL